jgi:hypothetical protein
MVREFVGCFDVKGWKQHASAWNATGDRLSERTSRQIAERWLNHLDLSKLVDFSGHISQGAHDARWGAAPPLTPRNSWQPRFE